MAENEKVYLILPGCDDTNRGDQALIWETVTLAKQAGFDGRYYMLADPDKSKQSETEKIESINLVLPHPSTRFKKNNNISYGKMLKLKWAFVSLIDCVRAVAVLCPLFRKLVIKLGSSQLKKSLSVFERADAAFVKGGGFLHAYGGIISTYTVFYQLYHIQLALSMGKDVYVMPNSYGPFMGPGSAWLVKKVLGKCKVITARESISKESLEQATGVTAQLFPDLAFYLEPCSELSSEQLAKLSEIPFGEKKCVALTMRPYRFPRSADPAAEYDKYKNTLCDFVRYLSIEGYHPVLIEHTYADNEHEQDMSCINDVAVLLGDSCEYTVYSDLSLTCRQLKYVYSKFDYIVGTRFHSVIFSVASGVPAIAITYGGNKGQGIMKDIGIDNLAIAIEDMTLPVLKKRFEYLVQNRDAVCSTISDYIAEAEANREKIINMLKGDIK